ncbi:MAG: zinc ribbon domain-containing protein [Selenomonadaceae bacterium]|nr:zinc ribbon domain-containing protein [Selenomonadaceae bacterium]
MAKRNCFEMLGVEFDPPDNIKKIKAAFEDWKKRLTTEQNTTVDSTRLNEIREELAMSNYIATIIDNPKFRQIEAEKLKQQRIEQLRLYIDLLIGDDGGTLQVNRAQMKKVSEKLHLSLSTVESTYRQKGFEIKNPRNKSSIIKTLNDFFLSENVMGELRNNFADFQTVPDARNYAWSASVNNLYDLAYNIEQRSEPSADSYRYLDAEELCDIFQREAQKVAAPVPAWHSIKTILHIAQMQVFNSNENRYKYDHSLTLEPLTKFFADLKAAPDIFKRDSYFADNCIERIQKSLPSVANKYELAVALYNKATGMLNDPYESADNPNETLFNVVCGNCHTSTQFRTREAVLKAKCPICGESFYTNCPKCNKMIPSSVDTCYSCGFSIMEMRKFPEYINEANEILAIVEKAQTVDVNVQLVMSKVMELVAKARMVKPDDLKLKALEDRVDKVTIAQKRQELLNWAKSKLPSLSMAPDKAVSDCVEILATLQKSGIKNYRPAIDRLRLIKPKTPISINATIKEIPSPAKPATHLTPAASITSKIAVNAKSAASIDNNKKNVRSRTDKTQNNLIDDDEIKLTCHITWQPANDLGVSYQLVRKVNGVPQNNKDGDILIDKTDKLEYEDKNIITGVLYGYAIFAVRVGAVSDPKTCEVVHYSDLEENNFTAKTEDGFCHFSWTLPSKNCLGVRILRSDSEGNSVVIADRVQSPFVDRAVKSKKQYQYRLQCVYYSAKEIAEQYKKPINNKFIVDRNYDEDRDFNYNRNYNDIWKVNHKYEYSYGLTVALMPESPPVALQNISYRIKNNYVKFNWQSTGDFSVLFREIKNTQLNIDTLKKVVERVDLRKLDTILGSNKLLAQADSRSQTCEFKLDEEFCKIAIVSATKTLCVICDVITIANVTPCTINKDLTSIDGGKLKIILDPLPENLFRIHYAVNNKNNKGRMYATVEDAKTNRLRFVMAKKYELDKSIIVHSPPPTEIYLTVIGEYKMHDGSTVYSEPSEYMINNRPKAEINYWLEWGSSGYFSKTPRAKNCKLIIETSAEYTPNLYLAYNKNGGLNIEPGESSTIIIHTIRESEEGFLGGHWEFPLDNSIWESISSGTVIKLLPSRKDAKYFEIRAIKPDTLKVPLK